MAGHVPGVELACRQNPVAKFQSRNSSTVWHFTAKSSKLLKGVSLLGVEHLQHFAIADVTLASKEGSLLFESRGQECVLDNGEKEAKDETETETEAKQPTTYNYTFKLKFHTKIFGTFKQTLVLDFGVRPLLSKVDKSARWR
jgi:hypothetical protein